MPLEKEEWSTLEETFPFAMKHLPDHYQEKAQKELNETPERRIAGLKELKEMARNHKQMCDIHFVDDFLLQFLRHRKYDVPRAFKQLVNFVKMRKNRSYLFLSIDNDVFFSDQRHQFCTILPRRCPEGCTMVLFEFGKWDPNVVSFQELQQMFVMMYMQLNRDPMTQINGIKPIYDFKDIPLKHARYCTPANLYLLYHGALDCFPGRFKELHLVGDSPILRTLWALVKHFLTTKLKQRVFVSSSRKDLLNHFPPSVLPVKYRGVLEDYYSMERMKMANKQQEGFGLQGQCNYY